MPSSKMCTIPCYIQMYPGNLSMIVYFCIGKGKVREETFPSPDEDSVVFGFLGSKYDKILLG